jgi:hypothetical protein
VPYFFGQQKNQVCWIHYLSKNEWLLRKGRRNLGERSHEAALRGISEEAGCKCDLEIYQAQTPSNLFFGMSLRLMTRLGMVMVVGNPLSERACSATLEAV